MYLKSYEGVKVALTMQPITDWSRDGWAGTLCGNMSWEFNHKYVYVVGGHIH